MKRPTKTTLLCESLIEKLYNDENNNNDSEIKHWKENIDKPQTILDMAVKKMSQDQLEFFNLITNDHNNNNKQIYMLAGLPGTGKSYLQTCIHLYYILQNKTLFCLAPTNLIAYQQNGHTVHSMLKEICKEMKMRVFNCDSQFIKRLMDVKKDKRLISCMSLSELCDFIKNHLLPPQDRKTILKCIYTSNEYLILIDEGTMVSSTLFSLLYCVFPNAKYLITYGPNQLQPPGENLTSCDSCIKFESKNKTLFYELVSQKRLTTSVFIEFVQHFSDVLSEKRIFDTEYEKLDKLEYFFKNIRIAGNINDYKLKEDKNKILIVSTNQQRCDENARRLKEEGDGPIYNIPTEMDERLPQNYDIQSRMGLDKILKIRENVSCIIRVNDLNKGLIKGQMVKITKIEEKNGEVSKIHVVVIKNQNHNKKKEEKMVLEKMRIQTDYYIPQYNGTATHYNDADEDDDKYCFIRQFPITLSYSLTAHSAQGKTLNCSIGVQLQNFGNSTNRNSFFVAITRVRDSNQLYMNSHPVCWLYPCLNIRNVQDLQELRKKKINCRASLLEYVNDFYEKKLQNDNMSNVNEMITENNFV